MDYQENIETILSKKSYETQAMNKERRRVFHQIYLRTKNITQAQKFSNVCVNIKYMKCTYPQQVMQKLQLYLTI